MKQNLRLYEHSWFIRITCDECGAEEEFPPVGRGYLHSIDSVVEDRFKNILTEKGWILKKRLGQPEPCDFCCQICYEQYMLRKG